MRIVGVDPGLTKSGWAILESQNRDLFYIESGLFRTNPKNNIYQRYYHIFQFFDELIQTHSLQNAALEETFVNNNNKSSLKLYGARTAIALAFEKNQAKFATFAPNTIKKSITGNGHADKQQLQAFLPKLIKNFPETIQEDCSDAAAIAYCGIINQNK